MHRSRPSASRIPARLVAVLTSGVLAATLLAAGVASPAVADDAESISGIPCDDGGEPDGRTRYTYEAAPGQQVTDCFRVENTGQVTQRVTLYATDAYNSEAGEFALLDATAEPVDAGAWVDFDGLGPRPEFDLAPGESRALPFTLTVADNAGPGDHAAGLIVSAQSPSDQILVDRRVGTRLYVRVPGDLQSLVNISGMTASYAPHLNPLDGSAMVTVTLTNQGNVAASPSLVLGVRNLFGADIAERRLETIDELLPGSTRTMSFTLAPVGQYVYVTPYASVFPREDMSGASAVAPPAPRVDRSVGLWAVPWLVLGALVLAAGVVLLIRWRRRRDDARAAAWVEFTEAEARRKATTDRPLVGAGTGPDEALR